MDLRDLDPLQCLHCKRIFKTRVNLDNHFWCLNRAELDYIIEKNKRLQIRNGLFVVKGDNTGNQHSSNKHNT
jgi:hypothetical protein